MAVEKGSDPKNFPKKGQMWLNVHKRVKTVNLAPAGKTRAIGLGVYCLRTPDQDFVCPDVRCFSRDSVSFGPVTMCHLFWVLSVSGPLPPFCVFFVSLFL